MNKKQLVRIVLLTFFLAIGSACSPRTPKLELPLVNEVNCKLENIASIKDKDTRNQFQDLCIRINTFQPSPKRSW